MALGLRDAGARVAVVGRSDTINELEQEDGFVSIRSDLTRTGIPEQVVAQSIEKLGGLDILIPAHGVVFRAPAESYPREQWDNTIATNLTSIFETSSEAAKHFLRQGRGKIIHIASMLSFGGGLMACAYAASKGGLAQLTKAQANEWGSRGVNVNAIAPGYIETKLNKPLRDDPNRSRQILDRLPAGRWGQPCELVGAVVFLASAASDYVHGVILPVDGGWLSR